MIIFLPKFDFKMPIFLAENIFKIATLTPWLIQGFDLICCITSVHRHFCQYFFLWILICFSLGCTAKDFCVVGPTTRVTWCDYEKVAQNVAQQIFCPNKHLTFTVEKIAQKFGQLRQLKKTCPILTRSLHLGENSPNLVTLPATETPCGSGHTFVLSGMRGRANGRCYKNSSCTTRVFFLYLPCIYFFIFSEKRQL
jgi:hypothetical protein